MTLGADDCVTAGGLHQIHETPDVRRVELHVGIDEGHQLADRLVHAEAQGEALTHVHRVVEDFDRRRVDPHRLADGRIRVPIRDDHDLVGGLQLVELSDQAGEILVDSGSFAVSRDDDGQLHGF